eukprot:4692515-Amphidinium_carterae.2
MSVRALKTQFDKVGLVLVSVTVRAMGLNLCVDAVHADRVVARKVELRGREVVSDLALATSRASVLSLSLSISTSL